MSSEESRLDKLIAQLKSNDVDVKVDALAKLQSEFENGTEVTDSEAVISAFKACLRISNQHLTSATLYAVPPLLPLLITRNAGQSQLSQSGPTASTSSTTSSGIVDSATLRYVLTSFLPPGGIIDRLGDKERPQAKAREALVILGGYAFRAGGASVMASKSGKGAETPLMIFERYLKEAGLASKVWKIREQSILTLVHIRRSCYQFPMRPYLSLLVDCLEDTDSHVRDCARTSVVELFSGHGVSDAARADLKKELTKKNVRKTIVDGVLSKLLSAGTASGTQSVDGSENGDNTSKPKEYVPPSLRLAGGSRSRLPSQNGLSKSTSVSNLKDAARPASRGAAVSSPPPPPTPTSENADVRAVYIASARDMETEFSAMGPSFEGKETEHNWSARDGAVQRVRGMLKGEAHIRYPDTFFACLKEGFMQWSLKTLASLRTTVSMNTCLLYSEMATLLGTALDPYCELLLTNLLKMAGFTKKITAQQSQIVVTDIILHTSAPPRLVFNLLWTTMQDKTVQARIFAIGHVTKYIEVHGQRSKSNIESSGGLEILDKTIKKALGDPNPAVRETARTLFWRFHSVWEENASVILNALDATARKQLERACPDTSVKNGTSTATPQPAKKSSIAAAIAASRAKAKAIAAAPPSLRHQATSSSSHTPATRRSTSPSATSPKSTGYARPSSPLRTVSSPGSPPSTNQPRAPALTNRSASSTAVPGSRSRASSKNSSQRAHSPSLSDHSSTRRRTSSPLATTSTNITSLRKAMATALPASPASSAGQISPPRRPSGLGIVKNEPVPVPGRQSLLLPSHGNYRDESMLLAQTVPIPEGDTDSEDDHSVNLMSFSAAFDKFSAGTPSRSQALSFSPKSNGSKPTASVSNALSSGSLSDMALAPAGQVVVEDALRARAEQAESAAERLLELVDEDDLQIPIVPTALGKSRHSLGDGNGSIKVQLKAKPVPLVATSRAAPPVTPNAKTSAILRQAAMFKDSPVNAKRTSSLLDVLNAQRHQTGWWLKRTTLFAKAAPSQTKTEDERLEEVESLVESLENGEVSKELLQKIALVCVENGIAETASPVSSPGGKSPASPTPLSAKPLPGSLHSDIWEKHRLFDRLWGALTKVLEPTRPEQELEYGLIVIWEMLENQGPYVENREADLFSLLLNLRYCNKINVLEATSTIRDALTSKIDPVYGLTTFHSCLKGFQAEPHPEFSEAESKGATYAFGLIALGKFILRLPAEIAEEELPRLKSTLIMALNDRSSLIVRESAASCIIAAQLVLRDETHLFALLDGLADDKKNLLTYLFDKHGARDLDAGANGQPAGLAKFEKEIRRLDTRTSTPSRVSIGGRS
ncbi:hypothetical protein FA15DRAFT_666821 [Coprinopsis marcescibilis]|uniref:TOG domain-containing protein n=1 Tax=Coprinopsis marcescibilis TaxID=230819 RepID=A0A5C3L2W2_COPMA|nr:hypothetical protein FA15DRAFT_666821 [Coprinopsis marcescibilis]